MDLACLIKQEDAFREAMLSEIDSAPPYYDHAPGAFSPFISAFPAFSNSKLRVSLISAFYEDYYDSSCPAGTVACL